MAHNKYACPTCGGELYYETEAIARCRINQRTGALQKPRLYDVLHGGWPTARCDKCAVSYDLELDSERDRVVAIGEVVG